MEIFKQINTFHAQANPVGLFGAVNKAYQAKDKDLISNLYSYLEDAENQQLYWLHEKQTIINSIESLSNLNTKTEYKNILNQLADYFADIIADDTNIAELLKKHFNKAAKLAKSQNNPSYHAMEKLGTRYFALCCRQIAALIDVHSLVLGLLALTQIPTSATTSASLIYNKLNEKDMLNQLLADY